MIQLLRAFFIICNTVLFGGLVALLGFFDRSGELGVRLARLWARSIIGFCGVHVEIEGLENLDPAQPYVFMANHQSLADTPVLIATLPVSFRFVAKRELTRVPFFGWALVAGGHVIVDRGNRANAVQSLARAARQIRDGTNVVIFPEGTRSATGEVGAFKSGGFHLAIDAGVPIVPVSVSGSQRVTRGSSLRVNRGRIKIHYGRPIPTASIAKQDRHALKERVRDAIRAGLDPELQGLEQVPLAAGATSGRSLDLRPPA